MECFKSEIFGPVVAVKRFHSEQVIILTEYFEVGIGGFDESREGMNFTVNQ